MSAPSALLPVQSPSTAAPTPLWKRALQARALWPRTLNALALATLTACVTPRAAGPAETAVPVTSENLSARTEFQTAVLAFEAGDFAAAADQFRIFGASYPANPLGPRAEIYLGRSLVATGDTAEAERVFASLATSASPDVAATGLAYQSFVLRYRGEFDRANDLLCDAMGGDFAPELDAIVPGDLALLLSSLAEARIACGYPAEAILDLGSLSDATADAQLAQYAVERAREVGRIGLLPEEALELATGPSAFARDAALVTAVRYLVSAGRADEADALIAQGSAALSTTDTEVLAALRAQAASGGSSTGCRYGVLLTLSGPSRRAGRAALGAILLAQRAFEAAPLVCTAVISDTYGSAEGTRRGLATLQQSGARLVIGPIDADLVAVARESAAATGLPLIALSTSSWSTVVPGTLRWSLDARLEADAVVTEAREVRQAARFVVVAESTEEIQYLAEFASAARDSIAASGGEVVRELALGELTPTAYAAIASTIAATDADAVVLAVRDEAAASLGAYLAAEDIWPAQSAGARSPQGRRQVHYLSHSFVATDTLLRNSATYLTGLIAPAWYMPDGVAEFPREFGDKFSYMFGRAPGSIEAFAYDAATFARTVLADGTDAAGPALAAELAAARRLASVMGAVGFDAFGNPDVRPRLITIAGDHFAPLD